MKQGRISIAEAIKFVVARGREVKSAYSQYENESTSVVAGDDPEGQGRSQGRVRGADQTSRNASPMAYDPNAQCPQFLNGLLYSALHEDDISLIERVGGAMLMGTNSAQRFLLLTGTAGGGKSTLVNIIIKIIGKQNVNQLRTEHLVGRFETFAYLGKTLLTGIDVPSDFLQQKGTEKIKSLVGEIISSARKRVVPNSR